MIAYPVQPVSVNYTNMEL